LFYKKGFSSAQRKRINDNCQKAFLIENSKVGLSPKMKPRDIWDKKKEQEEKIAHLKEISKGFFN